MWGLCRRCVIWYGPLDFLRADAGVAGVGSWLVKKTIKKQKKKEKKSGVVNGGFWVWEWLCVCRGGMLAGWWWGDCREGILGLSSFTRDSASRPHLQWGC